MKGRYHFIFFVLSCLFALSCLPSCTYRSYFGAGYHSLESQYLDKPHFDSIPKAAWHVSASATRATGYNLSFESDEEGDLNQAYEAMIYRSKTHRNISWAYGLFGYYGNYRLGNQHESVLGNTRSVRKNYHGVGGTLQVAWNIPYKRINIRLLGVDITVNREFGEYLEFTQQLGRQFGQVNTVDDPLGVNFGITSSIRYESQEGVIGGYQVRFAIPDRDYRIIYQNSPDKKQPIFNGASGIVFVGNKNFLFQAEVGVSPAQMYVGGGFTYRLPTDLWGRNKQ